MILFKIVPIFFIIAGAFYTVFPKVGWELRRFSRGTPSPMTLLFIRVVGVFCMIIGFALFNSFQEFGP
ncbi:hypothetical protein BSK56_02295 [Paenibacillus borealis]|uniref:DUF6199 domain-containing protein n=1 Tax=Paenibacillus borealis TaxID=160799 RepID=A0ABX3HQB4_PAEBO|nr:hypothetical protein [Paenibacillus borealis]OMD53081.1 hypothetical protein BSK56_02295 [Paenibacillus borealis]